MSNQNIPVLPGMKSITGPAYEHRNKLYEQLKEFFNDKGFTIVDTPLLEETELFIRKSGGELTSRLYTFTDPGGYKVSLRPEFTSSIIRHFIQSRDELSVPIRWHYGGPVFRYDTESTYRQFTQVGAELIGQSGIKADTEIIELSHTGLKQIGIPSPQLRIGHLGILHNILDTSGLSDPAKLFIISNIQVLKDGSNSLDKLIERANNAGTLNTGIDIPDADTLTKKTLSGLVDKTLRHSISNSVGRRSFDEIIDRLLGKLKGSDDINRFSDVLSLVSQLCKLNGPPGVILNEAKKMTSNIGLQSKSLDELAKLFDTISNTGIADNLIKLDFGLVRGISYYTGVIFELMHSPEVSIGGGGRYDDLVRSLGGNEDVPSIGFAYNLDQIVDILIDNKLSQ